MSVMEYNNYGAYPGYQAYPSYTGYSSDLLQTKLETVLGKKPTEAASVDWQLGEFRT